MPLPSMELKCVICGSPDVVKSHLMPAAFGRDIRGDGKQSWIGTTGRPGNTLTHSALFHQFRCVPHEQATQIADDYAVRFIRGFELTDAEISAGGFHRA